MLNFFMFLNYLNFLLYELLGIVPLLTSFPPRRPRPLQPNAYEYLCLHFYWAVCLLLFSYSITRELSERTFIKL